MLLARPVLVAVGVVCLAAGGCRPQSDRVARAAERAQPHLSSFEQFERWARRAAASEGAQHGRQALGEIVFAPIRRAPALLGAWVQLPGERPRVLALEAGAPLPTAERWVTLRDPRLGELQIAAAELCPVGAAAREPAPASCVVIARAESRSQPGAVTVTMAFANDDPP